MTVRETAELLGLKVRTIRQWISKGKLPCKKVGRCLIIPDDIVYSKEVQERADESREHSRRIKDGKSVGMLAGGSENT